MVNILPPLCMLGMLGSFLIILNGYAGKQNLVEVRYTDRPAVGPDAPTDNQKLTEIFSNLFDSTPIPTNK